MTNQDKQVSLMILAGFCCEAQKILITKDRLSEEEANLTMQIALLVIAQHNLKKLWELQTKFANAQQLAAFAKNVLNEIKKQKTQESAAIETVVEALVESDIQTLIRQPLERFIDHQNADAVASAPLSRSASMSSTNSGLSNGSNESEDHDVASSLIWAKPNRNFNDPRQFFIASIKPSLSGDTIQDEARIRPSLVLFRDLVRALRASNNNKLFEFGALINRNMSDLKTFSWAVYYSDIQKTAENLSKKRVRGPKQRKILRVCRQIIEASKRREEKESAREAERLSFLKNSLLKGSSADSFLSELQGKPRVSSGPIDPQFFYSGEVIDERNFLSSSAIEKLKSLVVHFEGSSCLREPTVRFTKEDLLELFGATENIKSFYNVWLRMYSGKAALPLIRAFLAISPDAVNEYGLITQDPESVRVGKLLQELKGKDEADLVDFIKANFEQLVQFESKFLEILNARFDSNIPLRIRHFLLLQATSKKPQKFLELRQKGDDYLFEINEESLKDPKKEIQSWSAEPKKTLIEKCDKQILLDYLGCLDERLIDEELKEQLFAVMYTDLSWIKGRGDDREEELKWPSKLQEMVKEPFEREAGNMYDLFQAFNLSSENRLSLYAEVKAVLYKHLAYTKELEYPKALLEKILDDADIDPSLNAIIRSLPDDHPVKVGFNVREREKEEQERAERIVKEKEQERKHQEQQRCEQQAAAPSPSSVAPASPPQQIRADVLEYQYHPQPEELAFETKYAESLKTIRKWAENYNKLADCLLVIVSPKSPTRRNNDAASQLSSSSAFSGSLVSTVNGVVQELKRLIDQVNRPNTHASFINIAPTFYQKIQALLACQATLLKVGQALGKLALESIIEIHGLTLNRYDLSTVRGRKCAQDRIATYDLDSFEFKQALKAILPDIFDQTQTTPVSCRGSRKDSPQASPRTPPPPCGALTMSPFALYSASDGRLSRTGSVTSSASSASKVSTDSSSSRCAGDANKGNRDISDVLNAF